MKGKHSGRRKKEKKHVMIFSIKRENSDIGNRTRGKHVRDAYVTNYTISEITFSFLNKNKKERKPSHH